MYKVRKILQSHSKVGQHDGPVRQKISRGGRGASRSPETKIIGRALDGEVKSFKVTAEHQGVSPFLQVPQDCDKHRGVDFVVPLLLLEFCNRFTSGRVGVKRLK